MIVLNRGRWLEVVVMFCTLIGTSCIQRGLVCFCVSVLIQEEGGSEVGLGRPRLGFIVGLGHLGSTLFHGSSGALSISTDCSCSNILLE